MLAFVAAERREFDGVLLHAERVVELDWPLSFASTAWLNGRAILLAANGPGPALARQTVDTVKERKEHLEGLVSIGFCGALDPALQPSDVLVASEVMSPNNSVALATPSELESCGRPSRTGKILSIDRVAWTAGEKARLRDTGADAVEMEAAAVAARARDWSVPFYCVKVVTDTSNESFPLDFNRLRGADGRFSRGRILAAALRQPAAIPGLVKLNLRCESASKALGEFIANARF